MSLGCDPGKSSQLPSIPGLIILSPDQSFEGGESFRADVVLKSFCVGPGDLLAYTDREQEPNDQLVAPS